MRAQPCELGRVVVSLQGHDRGRWFAVVGIVDERYVLIADGDTRKLSKPKKKQCKHLRARPEMDPAVMAAIKAIGGTGDSALRKALAAQQAQEKSKEECALVQE